MASRDSKNIIRLRIHTRIRRRVKGTPERPRLAVFRSVKHIYAQVIDDQQGPHGGRGVLERERARATAATWRARRPSAKLVAERAKDKGIKAVVFDRGGYLYHGRVKALAEAAREAGLEF